jgi:carbonic anhydrase/acetyltransferase-like protein (isoleucine patch superfamily)
MLLALDDRLPRLHVGAWAAPGAVLVGDVDVGKDASVWYGAVIRADGARITIGDASNIQDGCVVHTDPGLPVTIGARVTVGHRVVLHGCVIEDDVLIGMGAMVMNGAVVGRGSLVAAGAVVLEGTTIPPGSLVAGLPGKVRGETSSAQQRDISANARTYVDLKARHIQAQR